MNVLTKLGTLNSYEHVPESKSKLPVLVFLPGKGEVGTDATKLLVNGPSKFINEGWNPNFIIVSVQPTAEWANPAYVDAIVNNVIARYKDRSDGRLFLTGLSAGAYAIQNYIGYSKAYSDKITAIVSMSAPEPEKYFNAAYFTQPAWGFCGKDDSWYTKMKTLYDSNHKMFTTYNNGHCCWNQFYDPKYTEGGLNIYDFLLQAKAGDGGVSNPPTGPKEVIAKAGTDGGFYTNGTALGINPGDTLILSGNYTYFNLKGLVGTKENLINIICKDKVTIGGYKAYAFNMSDSSYFTIKGVGYNHIVINGGVDGSNSVGMAFNKCNNFVLSGHEFTNVSVAIMMKTTPKVDDPSTYGDGWSYENIDINDNHIYSVTGEGMYLGHSNSGEEPTGSGIYAFRLKNVNVFNNIVENTGWDGIQLTCGDGVSIYNNIIDNYGVARQTYQNMGIICAGNVVSITGNKITNGNATGITLGGNGICNIANNIIISAYGEGQDAIYINSHRIKGYEALQPYITANYIEHCKRNCIRVENTDDFMIPGTISKNTWKDSLGIVDNSDSLLVDNGEVIPPVNPPVRKLIATINIYDNGDVEKITI